MQLLGRIFLSQHDRCPGMSCLGTGSVGECLFLLLLLVICGQGRQSGCNLFLVDFNFYTHFGELAKVEQSLTFFCNHLKFKVLLLVNAV